MKIIPKNLRASSFVEVMVVMAIIAIMTGVVTGLFGTSRVNKELETNAREFVGVLREAQTYALTGKLATPNTIPCGFGVNWNGSSYTLTYNSKATSGSVCNSTVITTHNLKNGVTVSSSGTLYFSVPYANLSPGFPSGVQFNKGGKSYFVCIYSGGLITDRLTSCPSTP